MHLYLSSGRSEEAARLTASVAADLRSIAEGYGDGVLAAGVWQELGQLLARILRPRSSPCGRPQPCTRQPNFPSPQRSA